MLLKNSLDCKNLFKDELSSDVKFILHDRNGIERTVPAHKAILQMRSPVFQKMFYGGLKEGDSVRIVDVPAEAFTEYLQWFYLDEIELTSENISEVLKLADKYDTSSLRPFCQKVVDEMVQPEVHYIYYELALFYKLSVTQLERAILQDFKKTLNFRLDDGCTKSILENLLKSDGFACNEFDILRGVIAWAETSLTNRNIDVTKENVGNEIGDLLKYIRFPTMSAEEFLKCAQMYPYLLTQDEYFDIHFYIATKRPLTVAESFSTKVRKPDSVAIIFQPYDQPYSADGDHFYFELIKATKCNITIWTCITSTSMTMTFSVYFGNEEIHVQTIGDDEADDPSKCNVFTTSEPLDFDADTVYKIDLKLKDASARGASARFYLKHEKEFQMPFKSYASGFMGSIITKIEFTEVLD